VSNQFSDDNPYNAPQTPPSTVGQSPFGNQEEGDATGGVIPYKNVPALIAYYCGVFSLIPCVGLITGIAALILGIMGLRTYYANRKTHGLVHAWIGVVLGGGSALVHILLILLASGAAFFGR